MIKHIPRPTLEFLQQTPNVTVEQVMWISGKSERQSYRYLEYFNDPNCQCFPLEVEVQAKSASMVGLDGEEDTFDLDTFREYAKQMKAHQQKVDPVFNQDTIELDVDHPVGVMFVSCMHLGGRYTAYDEFIELYKRLLQTQGIYWGSLGDDIEGYLSFFFDKSAIEEQLITPSRQRELLFSVLSPLADANKLLFGTGSQHGSDWSNKKIGFDPIKQMYVNDFDVPFFDGTAYVTFRVGNVDYEIALSHEFKGSSQYNPLHPHKKAQMTRFPMADIVIMGDKHNPAVQWGTAYPDEYEKGNRNSPYSLFLQAGTAKTGLDKYTIKGWSRGIFEWPIVIFDPHRHHLEWTFSLDTAIKIMGKS